MKFYLLTVQPNGIMDLWSRTIVGEKMLKKQKQSLMLSLRLVKSMV